MPNTAALEQLTIALPAEVAQAVKARVRSGEFETEGDVLTASFLHYVEAYDHTLGMGREAFDEMLRREVLPALDGLDADPSSGLTVEQVRAQLIERRPR